MGDRWDGSLCRGGVRKTLRELSGAQMPGQELGKRLALVVGERRGEVPVEIHADDSLPGGRACCELDVAKQPWPA